MKAEFKEFYQYTPDEIGDFWENAIFSFDANILLNLYRYSESTCNEVLETFKYLSERKQLWLSYQAGFEYHNNRLTTITKVKNSYVDLNDKLSKKKDEIDNLLNEFKKHQALNTEAIKETFAKTIAKIGDELKELADKHPDFFGNDRILEALTNVFEGCIGNSLNDADLNLIYKEGKLRYEKQIPPGYKDYPEKKNEPERSLYGDLIIWKQLIKKAKESQRKFVFVTDDLKEDWWHISSGKTIGPRPELLKEFHDESGVEITIYKPEQFLKFYKDRVKKELKEETIKEVEETTEVDFNSENNFVLTINSAPVKTRQTISNVDAIKNYIKHSNKVQEALNKLYPTNYYFDNKNSIENFQKVYSIGQFIENEQKIQNAFQRINAIDDYIKNQQIAEKMFGVFEQNEDSKNE